MNYLIGFLVAVLVPLSAVGAPLENALTFTELAPGRSPRVLPEGKRLLRVDINSSISIGFSSGSLSSLMLLEAGTKQSESPSEKESLEGIIQGLDAWTQALVQAWEGASKLARIPKDDPKYDDISRATNKSFQTFFRGFVKYEEAVRRIPNGVERAANLRKAVGEALLQPPVTGQPKILKLFSAEVEFLNERLQVYSRGVHERALPIGIMMSAQLTGKGRKHSFHLPGYDKNIAGEPYPYEKLRLEPTAEDKRALAEINREVSDLASSLNEAKSLQQGLRTVGEKWLGEHLVKAKKVASDLNAVLTPLKTTDWQGKKGELIASAQAEIGDFSDSSYHAILSSAATIAEAKSNLATAFSKPVDELNALRQDIAQIEAAKHSGKPEIALSLALGLPKRLRILADSVSETNVTNLEAQLIGLENSVLSNMQKLPDVAKNRARRLLTAAVEPQASQIRTAFESVRQTASLLKEARELIPTSIEGQLASAICTDLPEPAQDLVPLNQANSTSINIMEAEGRQEGDRVRYRAWLYKMKWSDETGVFEPDGEPLDQAELILEVTRFGCYSRPGGGVIFVSRLRTPAGAQSVHGQPAPSISWMVDFRKWPKPGSDGYSSTVWSALKPSFGVHAATLRFNNTSGAELGLGLTASVFNDLVQAGYGWNINVPGRSDYWHVGFRLIHFGRGSGIKD